MVTFPQLFCLQRRHVGHPNFGPWGLANSIRSFSVHCCLPALAMVSGVENPVPAISVELPRHSSSFWIQWNTASSLRYQILLMLAASLIQLICRYDEVSSQAKIRVRLSGVGMLLAVLSEGNMRELLRPPCLHRRQHAVVARPMSPSALEATPHVLLLKSETCARHATPHAGCSG